MGIEIVTIVNSSGKIISNGGKLMNVLKEAKASYDEKKAAIKAEQAVKRSQTFDVRTVPQYQDEAFDQDYEYEYGHGQVRHARYHDDAASYASSHRSHGSRRSKATRQRSHSQARTALTMDNLKTHSEVSSVTPSRAPVAYRSPYAETSREMTLSRPSLAQSRSYAPSVRRDPGLAADYYDEDQQFLPQRAPMQRSQSDPYMGDERIPGKPKKEIDMDLAYGNIPPDLADRVDLDPAYQAAAKEHKAQALVRKVEAMLVEANCLHHTAQHTIKHLQENPEAAAAVALTLAELSAIVGKMSPAFLGALKGGSPAIFALLASPQFMIAAGVAVGMTVVMFGGWKIVKKVKEQQQAALPATPMAFEGQHLPVRPPYPITEQQYDEALVIEEELSTIESWRRGIAPFGEDESADLELISPEADRAIRSQYGGDDARSERSFRTFRSSRTAKTSKTEKTEKTSKSTKTAKTSSSRKDADVEVPERKSSKLSREVDAASEAGSHRSHRSSRSEKSDRTTKTSRSKRTLAIEDGSKDKENNIEAVLRPKKDSMLKNMFKKKTDASREKGHSVSSIKIN
ncbi:uncharacterized protein B0I36DRAFT_365062 [Microdochium trichocladiopsis]|uniref:Uncharacterized protein n=1 Tax=Microdochium trichocladiopsis TaxID=1682393 RepID=A0A9P8Y2Y6_9PEZI|nr:uncharacterized protein B0I36DRAFT_365062 [Microdochium trichocladiopsis]KAH7027933.1 hypothetical protein B0I36DRAFT_365062 [Microdochium trichocladiopsis]